MSIIAKCQQVPPLWMTSPCTDTRSGVTLAALNRITMLAKAWKVNLTIDWTVTATGFSNTAHGELADEPFGYIDGTPTEEIEIETAPWTGWGLGVETSSWPMPVTHWVYADDSVGDDVTLGNFSMRFALDFDWTSPVANADRASAFSDVEFELTGYVSFNSPGNSFTGDADDDIAFDVRNYRVAIAWENGQDGPPFFGTISATDSWTTGIYSYTIVAIGTVEPTEYWGFGGKINTTTGDKI